jgi:hypothetical protein
VTLSRAGAPLPRPSYLGIGSRIDRVGRYIPIPILVHQESRRPRGNRRVLALREGLPDSQLAVMPGAGHGSLDARIVMDFLAGREEET